MYRFYLLQKVRRPARPPPLRVRRPAIPEPRDPIRPALAARTLCKSASSFSRFSLSSADSVVPEDAPAAGGGAPQPICRTTACGKGSAFTAASSTWLMRRWDLPRLCNVLKASCSPLNVLSSEDALMAPRPCHPCAPEKYDARYTTGALHKKGGSGTPHPP